MDSGQPVDGAFRKGKPHFSYQRYIEAIAFPVTSVLSSLVKPIIIYSKVYVFLHKIID